jgi:hypothetical protein
MPLKPVPPDQAPSPRFMHSSLTRRGGLWHKSTVINLLERLDRRVFNAMVGRHAPE